MKKSYILYHSIETIEGVKHYEVCITDRSFKDIKDECIYYNDNTPYDKVLNVSFITDLLLNEEDLINIKMILFTSNNKITYNDLKGDK